MVSVNQIVKWLLVVLLLTRFNPLPYCHRRCSLLL
jgi:hypothetical protein